MARSSSEIMAEIKVMQGDRDGLAGFGNALMDFANVMRGYAEGFSSVAISLGECCRIENEYVDYGRTQEYSNSLRGFVEELIEVSEEILGVEIPKIDNKLAGLWGEYRAACHREYLAWLAANEEAQKNQNANSSS